MMWIDSTEQQTLATLSTGKAVRGLRRSRMV